MIVSGTIPPGRKSCGTRSLLAGGASIVPVLAMFAADAAAHPPAAFFVAAMACYLVCALATILFAVANFVQCARGRENSIRQGIGGVLLSLWALALIFAGIFDLFGRCGGDYPRSGSHTSPARSSRA